MLAKQLLPSIKQYIDSAPLRSALGLRQNIKVCFLAQGEYNLNYLLQSGNKDMS